MLKRRIVLGSLIAGAFLLPVAAGAGVVSGVCSNCHTMHASQNGVSTTPQGTLLTGSGCVSCHAVAGAGVGSTNANTGKPADGVRAPQVDNTTPPAAGSFINNGGYFDFTAGAVTDSRQHNVLGISLNDATLSLGANVAPGGTMVVNNAGAPTLTCAGCHGGSGLHHGTGSVNYRALTPVTSTTLGTQPASSPAGTVGAYGAKAAVLGVTSGNRRLLAYDATTMNAFCANCHSGFHGAANQDGTVVGDGIWIRHPTGVSTTVAAAAGPSIVSWVAATDTDNVPVGTTADEVMCISCHVPHGGPYADMLSYAYDATNNSAGDGTASTGCETCHSYGAGM